jgi:fucose 4-O-acetylase-like acetyltransferase
MVLHDTGKPYLVIYSFHIPLFLLLSGVFFNPNLPFWQSARTRADALLKPYLITLTAVTIQLGWFANKTTPFLESLSAILYGNARIPIWIPLWFLPHLFLLCLFAWLYLTVFQLEKRHPVIQAGLLLATLAAGYFMLRWFWPLALPGMTLRGLPFSADLLLVTSFYFILGYLFRERIKQLAPKYGWTLLAAAVFLGLHLVFNDSMDLNLRKYDNLVISTLQALAGIYLVLSISRMLSGIAPLARLLGYLGRNSLIILIFHSPIQRGLFNILGDALERKYPAGVLAFVGAVLASLLIAEGIRRIPVLKFLYLPVTHAKGK